MKRLPVLLTATAVLALSGCANVTTGERLAEFERPSAVCIVENPRVTYGEALGFLREAFENRGVRTVFAKTPEACPKDTPYSLNYTVRRSWDVTTYLGLVELTLRREGVAVAKAKYEAGDMNFGKWGRSAERMDGVVAKLLGED